MLGLDFHVIFIFCLHFALYKIHTWKLFVYEKIFAHGKINQQKKVLGKKKIKNKKQAQTEKEGVPLCQVKKKFLCEKDLYRWSFTLVSRFRTKKSLLNQNVPYMMLKMRFPFLYASTSLDTKTLTIASNCNFESCLSIRRLASQYIFRFFHLCHGFFLCLWQVFLLLCCPPRHSTERQRYRNVPAFPGILIHLH